MRGLNLPYRPLLGQPLLLLVQRLRLNNHLLQLERRIAVQMILLQSHQDLVSGFRAVTAHHPTLTGGLKCGWYFLCTTFSMSNSLRHLTCFSSWRLETLPPGLTHSSFDSRSTTLSLQVSGKSGPSWKSSRTSSMPVFEWMSKGLRPFSIS